MTYGVLNPTTLLCKGRIKLNVSKTPFQVPQSGNNEFPAFFQLDAVGNYFGLSGAYCGASIWGGSGYKGTNTLPQPRNWQGFVVNETGVFTISLGGAAPSSGVQYPNEACSPFTGPRSDLDNFPPVTMQGPGGILGILQPITSEFQTSYRFEIPGVLPFGFEDISSPTCPVVGYAPNLNYNDFYGYQNWPTFGADEVIYNQSTPYLIMIDNGDFFPVPEIISGTPTYPRYYPVVVTPPTPGSGAIVPYTFNVWGKGLCGAYSISDYGTYYPGEQPFSLKVDPFTGNCILWGNISGGNTGLYIGNVLIPNGGLLYDDPSLFYGNPWPNFNGVNLSNPNDQNYLSNYSWFATQQIPGGGFLLFPQGGNSSGEATGFIIPKDFSGYYAVDVTGLPSNWGLENTTYGVSSLGNLFLFDSTPSGNLYSSMGGPGIFDILGFPDLQVTAVGCRKFDACQLSFAG